MEGYLNVGAYTITFEKGSDYNKCCEGLVFNHFYVQSACNPLIEDYTEIFYMIVKGDIPSIQCKMSLRGHTFMRRVAGLSLIFIYFFVRALTPCLNSTETSLQLSQNITLFALYRILYRCYQQRDLDRHYVSGAYNLYIHTVQCGGQDGTLWNPCLHIPLAHIFHLRPKLFDIF
jgi:hypothetical protein